MSLLTALQFCKGCVVNDILGKPGNTGSSCHHLRATSILEIHEELGPKKKKYLVLPLVFFKETQESFFSI